MRDFKQFMLESKEMNRWFISLVFIIGMFVGTVLSILWSLSAVLQ